MTVAGEPRRDLSFWRRVWCVLFHGNSTYEEWVTTSRGLTIRTRELRLRSCGECGRIKYERALVIDGEDVLADAE